MIFSKKEKQVIAYTIEKCPSCKKELKRKFKQGDYLFVESSKCPACDIPMNIAKIFGEPIE
jgi:ssDNA-binding Zn-finger/Zn-ribbon topoisomerase 1